jgi:hypothetical protein
VALLTREGLNHPVIPLQIFQGVTTSHFWAKPLEKVAVRTQRAMGMRRARVCRTHSLGLPLRQYTRTYY